MMTKFGLRMGGGVEEINSVVSFELNPPLPSVQRWLSGGSTVQS